MIPDCVTWSLLLRYPHLSKRFHYSLCKMLDGGLEGGTTILTGARAFKGWAICDELDYPSDKSMPEGEYGNWQKIPQKIWDRSKVLEIQENKKILSNLPTNKSIIYVVGKVFQNREFTFIINIDSVLNFVLITFDVYSKDLLTVGWLHVKYFKDKNYLLIDDLFVKPDFRKIGIGSELLNQLHEFYEHNTGLQLQIKKIRCRIAKIDICNIEMKRSVFSFFMANSYKIVFDDSENDNPEYSKWFAIKTV